MTHLIFHRLSEYFTKKIKNQYLLHLFRSAGWLTGFAPEEMVVSCLSPILFTLSKKFLDKTCFYVSNDAQHYSFLILKRLCLIEFFLFLHHLAVQSFTVSEGGEVCESEKKPGIGTAEPGFFLSTKNSWKGVKGSYNQFRIEKEKQRNWEGGVLCNRIHLLICMCGTCGAGYLSLHF